MQITIQPTPEMFDFKANGVSLPTRVWVGTTSEGQPVDVYVCSIVPHQRDEASLAAFKAQLPPYMVPSRAAYDLPKPE